MKLIYTIPDKIYYIQDFLDYPTYRKIHYDVFKSKLIDLKSTKNIWIKALKYGHSNFVKKTVLDVSYKPFIKLKILLENNPFHKIKIDHFSPVLHSMEHNAGINWHDDHTYNYGITYYLNNKWNHKFGGEFMFKDVNHKGFIPVVGNSLVVVKAPFQHKVSTVLKPLVPRKSIQIFC